MGLYACNIQKRGTDWYSVPLFLSYFLFLINLVRGSSCISCHFRKDMDHCVLLVSRHGPELASVEVPRLGCCFRSSLFSPCGNGSYPRASPGRPLVRRYVDGLFPRRSLGRLAGLRPLDGLTWLGVAPRSAPHVPGSVHASRWRLSYGSCCLPLS